MKYVIYHKGRAQEYEFLQEGLEKYVGNDELWKKDLKSLREQIRDMCKNDPINKIGNFI